MKVWIYILCTVIPHLAAQKVYLYTFYTPSHCVFKDNWFLPSLHPEFDEIIIKKYDQECKKACWMKEGWTKTTLHKIEMIREAITQHWGDIIVYADIDIQFFRPFKDIIINLLEQHDIVFQRHNKNGEICSGFFALHANQKTLELCEDIYQHMQSNALLSDQPTLNYLLIKKNNPYQLSWAYLPDTFLGGGTLFEKGYYWKPGNIFPIPGDIILHHANCTRGIKNKIAQLKMVKKMVKQKQQK